MVSLKKYFYKKMIRLLSFFRRIDRVGYINDRVSIDIENFDFAIQKDKSRNTFTKVVGNIFRIFIIIIFSPIMGVFYLFSIKEFSRIFKQVAVILYLILFSVFIYTLFNQNKNIVSDTEIVNEINYKNKIRTF